VGDPFEEKRLIEACLELLDRQAGGGHPGPGRCRAGLRHQRDGGPGGVGMDVDVSAVPRREPGMEPFEVMTSESQERMLAIVTPADLAEVEEVCRRWEVRAGGGGPVTAPDRCGRRGAAPHLDGFDGEVLADVPAASLSDDAPLYDRPHGPARPTTMPAGPTTRPGLAPPPDCGAGRSALLADPSWVFRQYDHQLFLNTVAGPGGDAAVLRLAAPGLPPPAGPGSDDRLQSPLVRARSPGRHRPDGGRVGAQRGLCRGPARWPSSTASTSATPSTPRSCGSSRSPSTAWPRPAGPSACR
jgi:phosphoribosylformylglycinamidine (FGAM) synthase-like enzyme